MARAVSEEVFEFFKPLLSKTIDPSQENDLRSKLMELCNKVVELRMTMRRSKDRYTYQMPGTADWSSRVSRCKDLAEALAVEGGRPGQASESILYTVFGGLV
jgi:hypothetical protein